MKIAQMRYAAPAATILLAAIAALLFLVLSRGPEGPMEPVPAATPTAPPVGPTQPIPAPDLEATVQTANDSATATAEAIDSGATATAEAQSNATATAPANPTPEPTATVGPTQTPPQEFGAWTQLAAMIHPRYEHKAIELADGRILVAGGRNAEGMVLEAEIYDPVTNTWSGAGVLGQGRGFLGLVELDDGRVLAIGGFDGLNSTDSSEIWDPSTNTWSDSGRLNVVRDSFAYVEMTDGRVLIFGGFTDNLAAGAADTTAEVFDPATGVWSEAGETSVPRTFTQVLNLPDGRVMVIGTGEHSGDSFGGSSRDSHVVDLFDPVTNEWTRGPDAPAEDIYKAVLLDSSTVMALGGQESYVYDIGTDSWTSDLGPGERRRDFAAGMTPDGRVAIVGGNLTSGFSVQRANDLWVFDPQSAQWFSTDAAFPFVVEPRTPVLATREGRVIVVGGRRDPLTYIEHPLALEIPGNGDMMSLVP